MIGQLSALFEKAVDDYQSSSVTFGFLLMLMLTMTMIINWGSTQLIDNIDNVENDVDHESNKLGESTQLIDNGWAE